MKKCFVPSVGTLRLLNAFHILANHALRPLARLVAKMTQESPQQSIQIPESLQTHTVKSSKAIKHAWPDLHRAGTPNYSFDKHISFVYPSLFDAKGASAVP